MNTRNITILTLVVLFVGVAAAFGQQVYGVRATIPFEFTVESETYPAGEYMVTFPMNLNSTLMLLTGSDGKALRLVGTTACDPKQRGEQAYLLFRGYGNRMFLSQVWTGTSSVGRELKMSKAEREIVKSAYVKPDPKRILVAAY